LRLGGFGRAQRGEFVAQLLYLGGQRLDEPPRQQHVVPRHPSVADRTVSLAKGRKRFAVMSRAAHADNPSEPFKVEMLLSTAHADPPATASRRAMMFATG
jgi:hypothetical protein